ncbi:MAG TPA: hypothetical protein VF916_06065, partial [Ktedonobacterales bacterium]
VTLRWRRPRAGPPTTVTLSHEADGWEVSFACAAVPTPPLAETGRETGLEVGLPVFRLTADGDVVASLRHSRTAEQPLAKAQQRGARRKQGSPRRTKAVARAVPRTSNTSAGNGATVPTRRRLPWCVSTT